MFTYPFQSKYIQEQTNHGAELPKESLNIITAQFDVILDYYKCLISVPGMPVIIHHRAGTVIATQD